ncbi:MAG TPA: hypothetical protein PK350_02165 [Deltaproteobacteria bacterium]|nr:hypothetical protein [Deltaproteobacteria bacterium]
MNRGKIKNLLAVLGNSRNNVFAVGLEGMVCRYDGREWNLLNMGVSTTLTGVWSAPENTIFAVGHEGMILHFNGSAWETMASGTTDDLLAVWGTSTKDVYAVGQFGTVLHFNGNTWRPMTSGASQTLYGIWGTAPDDIYAVGKYGTMIHFDGTAWAVIPKVTASTLLGVWGSSSSDVFAVGDMGTILHYDGSSWRMMESNTLFLLNGIWGASDRDVFSVGENGTVLHYDGIAWNQVDIGTNHSLRQAWGSSAADVFVVGDAGTILHYRDYNKDALAPETADLSAPPEDSFADYGVASVPLASTMPHQDTVFVEEVPVILSYKDRMAASVSLLDFLMIMYAEYRSEQDTDKDRMLAESKEIASASDSSEKKSEAEEIPVMLASVSGEDAAGGAQGDEVIAAVSSDPAGIREGSETQEQQETMEALAPDEATDGRSEPERGLMNEKIPPPVLIGEVTESRKEDRGTLLASISMHEPPAGTPPGGIGDGGGEAYAAKGRETESGEELPIMMAYVSEKILAAGRSTGMRVSAGLIEPLTAVGRIEIKETPVIVKQAVVETQEMDIEPVAGIQEEQPAGEKIAYHSDNVHENQKKNIASVQTHEPVQANPVGMMPVEKDVNKTVPVVSSMAYDQFIQELSLILFVGIILIGIFGIARKLVKD